jgi:DNA helicase HerA-like ATPase
MDIDQLFPKGILRLELLMGFVNSVGANFVQINFTEAGAPSGSYFQGGRYGKGEVGEFVIIEGQTSLVLGRVVEVTAAEDFQRADALGRIHLLGSISMETLKVTAGVESYPRLGDKVYAAPHALVALIPVLMDQGNASKVSLSIGSVDVALESKVYLKPEKLFGRHLAILGSTGGGKSWTTAKILDECLKFNSKLILLDPTGEYRGFETNADTIHTHLASPVITAISSKRCALPPTSFQESDFIALFDPAGKVQGPKLREAIKSLRLANLFPDKFPDGYVKKIKQDKGIYRGCLNDLKKEGTLHQIEDPSQPFNVHLLVTQLVHECVYPDGGYKDNPDPKVWGNASGDFAYCLSLVTRIESVLKSPTMDCVFGDGVSLIDEISTFLSNGKKLLRIDLSGVSFEFKAREIISNAIGRYLLSKARSNQFTDSPMIVFLDEAHNFLGKHIGGEDSIANLDAFELIAKEGRKFGLNICMATQRPRDITEGVLSQVGTMIVHRLTNDRDREVVERACGEIDRAASAFLPNLQPGEAAILGNDFPIPLTIQIDIPDTLPKSSGPNFQEHWRVEE